jgi:predicted nucleic acid-binding protein
MAATLLDTNVLVHAAYARAAHHSAAARLVRQGLDQPSLYCIAPQNLIEFAAVATRARFVTPPMQPEKLAQICDHLYRSRNLAKIYPRRGTVIRAIREGAAMEISGPRWYDLFLAMTMRDAGVEVIVTDNRPDFQHLHFISVKTINEAAA